VELVCNVCTSNRYIIFIKIKIRVDVELKGRANP
jgi:hypothetical protein